MIKLPKKIVIYPQKHSKPDYLLCWIPAESYEKVSLNEDVRQELTENYPNGLEVELSEDGLEEFGIQFEFSPEELHQAYLELNTQELLPESGMVEVELLGNYLGERNSGRSVEEITQPAAPETLSFGETESAPLKYLKGGPEMVGDEDPEDMFQRFSVRQVNQKTDQSGEE